MRRLLLPLLLASTVIAVPLGQAAATRTSSAARTSAPARVSEDPRDLSKATPESAGVSSERLKRLDAGLQRFVDEGRLAGVTTLLARHGRIVNANAFGKKNLNAPDPLQRDSIFRIYSMTKPITGVAMMMLYEEGKWRLDDPVTRYIPELAKLQVFLGENPDGTMKLEDARRPITMRELMTHSGGLGYILNPNAPVDKLFIKEGVLNPAAPLQTMIDKLAKMPLLSQPGTRWSVQHRRRRAGLSRGEVVGPAVRGFPQDATLRSARDEGHRVLRAEGEGRPSRAAAPRRHGRQAHRARTICRRTSACHLRVPPAAAVSTRRLTTTCASRRCC